MYTRILFTLLLLAHGLAFSQSSVSGGLRYELGDRLVVDATYTKPIIELFPYSIYSSTTLQGEVTDEFGYGVQQGFGIDYYGEDITLSGEIKLKTLMVEGDFSATPSISLFFVKTLP